jgi:hypothetical protein
MKYAISCPKNLGQIADYLMKNGIDVDTELTREREDAIVFSGDTTPAQIAFINAYFAEKFDDGWRVPPEVWVANDKGSTSLTFGEMMKINKELGLPPLC